MSTAVLVTGATGFLGGHLAHHLAADGAYDVHVLQRAGSDPVKLEALARAGAAVHTFASYEELPSTVGGISPDIVVHLATHYLKGHTGADIGPLIDANVTFGTHLLESLVGGGAVVVTAMSYFQFVSNEPSPVSLYSATKQAFMAVGDFYRAQRALDVRNVVLFDTYGPDDSRDKLVPHLIRAALRAAPVSIGPSAQGINLLYADDVVSGLLAVAQGPAMGTVALKSPVTPTVGDVVAALGRAAGRPLEATFNDAAPVNRLVETAGQWPAPVGWEPRVNLEDGLGRILAASR